MFFWVWILRLPLPGKAETWLRILKPLSCFYGMPVNSGQRKGSELSDNSFGNKRASETLRKGATWFSGQGSCQFPKALRNPLETGLSTQVLLCPAQPSPSGSLSPAPTSAHREDNPGKVFPWGLWRPTSSSLNVSVLLFLTLPSGLGQDRWSLSCSSQTLMKQLGKLSGRLAPTPGMAPRPQPVRCPGLQSTAGTSSMAWSAEEKHFF